MSRLLSASLCLLAMSAVCWISYKLVMAMGLVAFTWSQEMNLINYMGGW